VTERAADADGPPATGPPATGVAAVDDALAELGDLRTVPVQEHHDRLARAAEALHETLHDDRDAP
jgi:hypothetical protein